MKLNKTLMIAALIAGSVFAADYAARAQDSTNTPPAGAPPQGGPGARGGRMNFDNISTQLALTDDQKTKVKPIIEDMLKKMADVRKDDSLQPTDKRTKNKQIRDDATTQLKDILTADQLTKWQKMIAGGGRRGGAGAPPPA